MVLWDYGVNDADAHKGVYHQGRYNDLRKAAAEVFMKELRSLPNPPVVVLVEGRQPVAAHLAVADRYDLHVISYHDATARAPGGLGKQITWGANQCPGHPANSGFLAVKTPSWTL